VPYYWLLSGLVVGLTLLSGLPDPHRIPATVLFIPFSERGFEMPYLAVGWTLCFEMLFYLCVYLARAWLFWTPRGRFSVALALFAGLFALARPEHLTLFLLNPMILEFGFGIGLAWLYRRGTVGRTDAGYLLAFGLIGFALNLVFGFGHASELECTVALPGAAYRVLVFGVPSAGVVGGLLLMERAGMRIGTALEGLGNASYSIYLTHTITFELLRAAVARDSLAPDLLIALALVLGVAVGFVAYHALERPLLRALGSRTAPAVEGRPGLAATGTARP
jgi:exopolysaccharide production protein ExoZ